MSDNKTYFLSDNEIFDIKNNTNDILHYIRSRCIYGTEKYDSYIKKSI